MTATPHLVDYQLRLEGFEGPLDVLLRLIERDQLEISDLSLVMVTESFLEYIAELQQAPPQLLAEFLGIASRLLVLKTRALLPRPVTEDDDETPDLTQQLREYQRAKRIAGELRERETTVWRTFARLPAPRTVNIRLELPSAQALRSAFERAISRQPGSPEIVPIRRQISIGDMTRRILTAFGIGRSPRRFGEIVAGQDREVIIAGFIALLALWNRKQVELEQAELFEDIVIYPETLEA